MIVLKNKYFLAGTLILSSGDFFDSATTAIALINPLFAGQFVEVGDPFIRFFMYDLGMGTRGFIFAICISVVIDLLIIYGAARALRSYTSSRFSSLFLLMVIWGIGHWIAGIQNLSLLLS